MKSLQLAMLPDDENGDVLRAMVEDGDDLTIAREVAFHLVFAEEPAAAAFAHAAKAVDELVVAVPLLVEEGIWQVTASRHMSPTHPAITRLEHELTVLAESFGGYPDGWECSRAAGPVAEDESGDVDVG